MSIIDLRDSPVPVPPPVHNDYWDSDEDDGAFLLALEECESARKTNTPTNKRLTDSRNNLIHNHHLRSKLVQDLFPYQVYGVEQAIEQFRGRLLLCDEMGLGKTHQALCIASKYLHHGTCLILCPASLRRQWAEHTEKLLPLVSPTQIRVVDSSAQSLVALLQDTSLKVIICSHALSRTFFNTNSMPVIGMTIVDEAHAMREGYRQKNGSLQATSMCRAVIASKYAILLTGTPVFTSFENLYAPLECLIGCGKPKTRSHTHKLNCSTTPWPEREQAMIATSASNATIENKKGEQIVGRLPCEWSGGSTKFKQFWGVMKMDNRGTFVINPKKSGVLRTWLLKNIMIRRTSKDVKNELPKNLRVIEHVDTETMEGIERINDMEDMTPAMRIGLSKTKHVVLRIKKELCGDDNTKTQDNAMLLSGSSSSFSSSFSSSSSSSSSTPAQKIIVWFHHISGACSIVCCYSFCCCYTLFVFFMTGTIE